MTEQTSPLLPDADDGELVAGTPPAPAPPPPPPAPEEMGSSKFPPAESGALPPPPGTHPPEPGQDVEEDYTVYTAAEVQAASEEMKKLPPQVFIEMKRRVEELGDGVELGEAGGVVWTTLYSETGAELSVTDRRTNSKDALDALMQTVAYAASRYKLSSVQKGSSGGGGTQVTNVPAGVEVGTGPLNWISVDRNENDPAKLVVKFSVGQFKWPFQEHRGADKALSLFDSALCEPRVPGGWSEEHFATAGARYEINGTLHVDWEHKGKYYNVLKVHS